MKSSKMVGIFQLGPENVELWLHPGRDGGSFDLAPSNGGQARIDISTYDGKRPGRAMEVLLHEAFEFCCARLHLRFANAPSFSFSSGDYLFVMDHEQYAEVTSRAGAFLALAWPVIQRYVSKP